MRFLCITPNPAIDRTLAVPGFAAGAVWRAKDVRAVCGGKGVNVARAARRLGADVVLVGPLAGATGRAAADLALAEGIPARWTWVDGETRVCVIVVGDDGEATVINEPGPGGGKASWGRIVADVAAFADDMDAVCISGSMPPCCPPGGVAALVDAAGDGGRPVWVDTSGPPLAEALAAMPAGVKVNGAEAGELLGHAVTDVSAAGRAAKAIGARTGGTAVVTLGTAGAVMAVNDAGWWAEAPPVDTVSAVGSGDAFLAGLVVALARGMSSSEALALAAAAGAANAERATAGDIDSVRVTGLAKSVRVEPVPG